MIYDPSSKFHPDLGDGQCVVGGGFFGHSLSMDDGFRVCRPAMWALQRYVEPMD